MRQQGRGRSVEYKRMWITTVLLYKTMYCFWGNVNVCHANGGSEAERSLDETAEVANVDYSSLLLTLIPGLLYIAIFPITIPDLPSSQITPGPSSCEYSFASSSFRKYYQASPYDHFAVHVPSRHMLAGRESMRQKHEQHEAQSLGLASLVPSARCGLRQHLTDQTRACGVLAQWRMLARQHLQNRRPCSPAGC